MNPDKRMQTFQTPSPVRLQVDIPRGRIHVMAEETGETRIELTAIHGDATARAWIADAEIVQSGGEIIVHVRKTGRMLFGMGGSIEVVVHAPTGSSARLSSGSGDIETLGRLGEVVASSGSGEIRLGDNSMARARTGSGNIAVAASAGSVDAKTGSGHIIVGKVGADAVLNTGSGHAELALAAGSAQLSTGSGNIDIDQAGDSLEAFAASGHVKVGRADHGRVRARTISGRVSVGVAKGVAAHLDVSTMSGKVRSELDAADAPGDAEQHVELILSTISGNINIDRAASVSA